MWNVVPSGATNVVLISCDNVSGTFPQNVSKSARQKCLAAQHGSERKRDTNFGRSNKTKKNEYSLEEQDEYFEKIEKENED